VRRLCLVPAGTISSHNDGKMNDVATTCEELRQQLAGYFDGELDPRLCVELERHLRGCDPCRVFVDSLRRTILLYRDYGRAPAPSGARARLIRVLKLEKREAQPEGVGVGAKSC
jgi:anti-sigma factor RsiW